MNRERVCQALAAVVVLWLIWPDPPQSSQPDPSPPPQQNLDMLKQHLKQQLSMKHEAWRKALAAEEKDREERKQRYREDPSILHEVVWDGIRYEGIKPPRPVEP